LDDEAGPYWMVNLPRKMKIGKVKILNRGDCCNKRIEGVKIFVDD
jgi:hypothetical protein